MKKSKMRYKFIPLQGEEIIFNTALKAYTHLLHKNYEVKIIHQNLLIFLEKEVKDPFLKDYINDKL